MLPVVRLGRGDVRPDRVLQPLLRRQVAFFVTIEMPSDTNPTESPTNPNAAALVLIGHALTAVRERNVPEAATTLRSLKPLTED